MGAQPPFQKGGGARGRSPPIFGPCRLWPNLRIDYKLCLLMHSATVQCCPRYISDIVQTTAASSCLQGLRSSSDAFSYTVPLTYTKFEERAFSVAGPSVWNSLSADIRHITDISTFKRHLKTHIFSGFRFILNSVIRFFITSVH